MRTYTRISIMVLLFLMLVVVAECWPAEPTPMSYEITPAMSAFTGVEQKLVMLNASSPFSMGGIGALEIPGGQVEDISVSESIACIAGGSAGLRIADVSVPANPREIGCLNTPGYTEGVAMLGNYAFVADGGAGLRVVDISEPTDPREAGFAHVTGYAFDVEIAGDYAYIAGAGAGLLVVDISDPTLPVEVGNYDTPGYVYGLAVVGTTVYLADAWGGFRVIDVSNPMAPHEIGSCKTPGWSSDVVVMDNLAYVADAFAGVRVIDISDPANPMEVDAYEDRLDVHRISIIDNTIYATGRRRMEGTAQRSYTKKTTHSGVYESGGFPKTMDSHHSMVNGSAPLEGQAPGRVEGGLRLLGQIGGPLQAIAVEGDYAYVGIGLRVEVLDVSDLSNPRQVGTTAMLDGSITDITIVGNLAYATTNKSLWLIDISDIANLRELGYVRVPGYAEGVAVEGSHAYVSAGGAGLRVVDISDPEHPRETAYVYTQGYAFDVKVAGDFAYIAGDGSGLRIVDISDPEHPAEAGGCDTPGYAHGVAVIDHLVLVADEWGGLRIIDVSASVLPVEISVYDTPGQAFDIDVVGNVAYISDAFAGLVTVDVSDPAMPVELGDFRIPEGQRAWVEGHAGNVVISDNMAYIADYHYGLRIVDVADPMTLTQAGFYPPFGYANAVAVSGDYAYVATATQGLRVVDISSPTRPVVAGGYDTQSPAIGVAVTGDQAYIATGGWGPEVKPGLHVVDISDPAHPTKFGYYGPAGAYRDIVVSGEIACIPDEHGLVLLDISSPHSPVLSGKINLQGEEWGATSGVAVNGNLAYVAQDVYGMRIVDISDPASPVLISTFRDPEWGKGYGIAVAGTNAYVTHHGGSALKIIDIVDPLHPVLLGAYHGPGLPERLDVVGSVAYMAFGQSGIQVIDIADPSNPILIMSYDTLGYAIASAVAGNLIYVADGNGGMAILQIDGRQLETSKPIQAADVVTEIASSGGPQVRPRSGGVVSLRDTGGEIGWYDQYLEYTFLDVKPVPSESCTRVATRTFDGGPGTLRECMAEAVHGDTITFDPEVFPPTNPVTISLTSPLPPITQGSIILDASNAGVILDGSLQEGSLTVISDSNAIRGLQILNFPWAGVNISGGAKHNVIGGNRTRGNGPTGEGNVISGNGIVGISICDTGTTDNIVIGNFIGTDASGTLSLGNGYDGIDIYHGACNNTIGSLTPGEGNVISGNENAGVWIGTVNTMGNQVIGNFVGTDVDGTSDLGNIHDGVFIGDGAVHNTVKRNLISGNGWDNVLLSGPSGYNTVIGNLIGTDVSGTSILNNGRSGVSVFQSPFNRIGGTADDDRNVISGNHYGIGLSDQMHNLILGNYIGTDISGINALGNVSAGIMVFGGKRNFIGGMTEEEGNVISDNSSAGISIARAELNFIAGNAIGTDRDRKGALGNGMDGIDLNGPDNYVGPGNTIVSNGGSGVMVNIRHNTITRNTITRNTGKGILPFSDVGNEIMVPVVTHVAAYSVSGTASPNSIIEIFSDAVDEGEVYEGTTKSDRTGAFAFSKPKGLTGPNITATATDSVGNTSGFTLPVAVKPPLAGDFNTNGKVDFQDFLLFAKAFGSTDLLFDLNSSGSVDFGDFIIFARNYGKDDATQEEEAGAGA